MRWPPLRSSVENIRYFFPRTAEYGEQFPGNEERRGAKFTVDFGNSQGVLVRTIYLGTGRRQMLARTIYFAYREMLNPRTPGGDYFSDEVNRRRNPECRGRKSSVNAVDYFLAFLPSLTTRRVT